MSLRTGTDRDLLKELSQMDGRPYGAYRSLAGTWDYGDFTVAIDRVQSDPYAPPSVLRAWTTPSGMGLPDEALASSQARLAAADYLARIFYDAAHARAGRDVQIPRPRQEVLQRSYALVLPDRVEVRFQVRLPARGRTILGRTAARLFDVDVPNIIMDCFDFVTDDEATNTKRRGLLTHIAAYEDYCALREALDENGWVAFVADGAVLARRSGVSQLPLADAVPFISPAALRASVDLPHAGAVTGLAIPPGITLIAGGGYHGKSTLLAAIERGVYPHAPGDGRELVATVPDAVKVRAADGRAVTGVDLSPFISHLPGGRDTTAFTTKNASGSTSQAASIIEAIEAGASALLLDEDTSATNLLIRDARMRALVADEREPITPFVDRVGALSASGVSTVMVMGGSGDYLDVADRVVLMDSYALRDATTEAAAVAAAQPRVSTALSQWPTAGARVPLPSPPRDRRGPVRTRSRGLTQVTLDREDIDVADVSGIVDPGQTEAIAHALRALLEQRFDGESSLAQCLEDLDALLDDEGLDALGSAREHPAFLVRPRAVDVAGAVNRYRSLELA